MRRGSVVGLSLPMKLETEKVLEKRELGKDNIKEIIPPDGGWGWFCVIGCALMHTFLIGTERTFGLLYLELVDKFNESAALTAWVGSLTTALRMGLGPLASLLSSRFTCRKVTMVGGLIFFSGVVLSSFPPNLFYLFFTWGVLVGVGGAMVYTPSFIIVGKYFDKRRAIANGISTAGGGIGQFTFPPLYTALLGHYGYMGSLLVLGAITLNLVNCGALYRPLKPIRTVNDDIEVIEPEGMSSTSNKRYQCVEMQDQSQGKRDNGDHNGDTDSIGSIRQDGAQEGDDGYVEMFSNDNGKTNSVEHLDEIAGSSKDNNDKETEIKENHEKGAPIAPGIDSDDEVVDLKGKGQSKKGWHLDCSLLCDPTFVLFACFIGFGTQAYVPTSTFVPALVVNDRGFTKEDATMLIVVIGIADMCGRLGSGIIFDIKPIQRVRRYIYGLAPLLLCVFLASFPFATLYWHFIVISVGYGLSVGMFLSQIASLLADWLGKERLPSAIGLATFFRGAGVLVGPVIGGLLYDITGSYNTSFYYSASAALCSGLVYFSLVMMHQIKQRRLERIEPIKTDADDGQIHE
ncbi:monocarboxylate transporter 13-like [Lineus longissimus]|uniref:monocarboxylate transporter 13-like n=1 Tax=Lineus longissimus TaxID=88925 RepID=UPI002B4F2237